MLYTIKSRFYNRHDASVAPSTTLVRETVIHRRRIDAAQFQAHKAVYEAAGAQGLRDRQCAWDALNAAVDACTRPGYYYVHLGSFEILIVRN